MRSPISILIGVSLIALAGSTARALDATWEYAVRVSAKVKSSPPEITLAWPQDSQGLPKSYTIYRKSQSEASWGKGVTLPGSATAYVDKNVIEGATYEYQIVKASSGYTGYGYIYTGINAPPVEDRGKIILIVDNTYGAELAGELARLEQDMTGDGWTVLRHDVARTETVKNVKRLIVADYQADPANVKALFLFGHVPVPYSGNIIPDGHYPDHQGAWPADAYYGDMDGEWTDSSLSTLVASDPRNRNIPGDGKFDQSKLPSEVELEVGRVDLANLPGRRSWNSPGTFPNELTLLRQYLHKDHAFRQREFSASRRAILYDDFGFRGGEAFAASGYRNLAPFFGAENIQTLKRRGEWVSALKEANCLWAYGCGAGSYTTLGGLGSTGYYNDVTTTELVQAGPKAVFLMVFGSWLGDWDSEDNIMRAVLAAPGGGLAAAWSGRPHWFLHHMGLGENIGYSARLTQNNGPDGLYKNQVNSAAGQIHVALMGDPTLRMHVVAPPSNLTASGGNLTWTASDDQVVGYHVYGAKHPGGPFKRLTSIPLKETTFTDATLLEGQGTYMVRALKLESTPSGTYFNLSQGSLLNMQAGLGTETPIARTASNSVRVASKEIGPGTPKTELPKTGPKTMTPVDGITVSTNRLPPTGLSTNMVWVEDDLPTGAVPGNDGGDSWTWVTSNPPPFSGTRANQSSIAAGLHQHFFNSASATLNVNQGDTLVAYIYLDPRNLPTEVMLQWTDGSWEHRAYWGANSITYGINGTASRRYVGPLPPAGQWARLEVPASQVGLESRTVKGMAFSLYGGRATWDYAGKSRSGMAFTLFGGRATWDYAGKSSAIPVTPSNTNAVPTTNTNPLPVIVATNPPPVIADTNSTPVVVVTNSPVSQTNIAGESYVAPTAVSVADYLTLELPKPGDATLHILSPTFLELKLINAKDPDPAPVSVWNFVNSSSQFIAPSLNEFTVTADGQAVSVKSVGFKRRPLYAPLTKRDLRIENCLFLELANPIADRQKVEVKNLSQSLWPSSIGFSATAEPLRFSPAIHVNQEGYVPSFPKKAMIGYYAGSLGELNISASAGFELVDANTGAEVFQGALVVKPDIGWKTSPAPYQKDWPFRLEGL